MPGEPPDDGLVNEKFLLLLWLALAAGLIISFLLGGTRAS